MKLAHFPNCCALNSQAPMTAFLHSCRQHGIQLDPNSRDADAAVIWSVTWTGRMQANQEIYQHYTQTGRPVIILEVGALHRGHTWKIAVNNITADGYYGHLADLDPNRPAKLKIPTPVDVVKNPSVLIVAQHAHSLQAAQLESVDQWIMDTVRHITAHTDRPIVLRPHPRSRIKTDQLPKNIMIETPKRLQGTYDSFDIDYRHWAVINHNSGAGVQAALAGAVVMVDPSSLAHPVSSTWDMIDQVHRVDQHQWTVQIAHTEYLIQEIERGQWIQRLAPMLPL